MYLAECVGEGVVPRRVLTPDHLTAMPSNIPAASGSPVRRSDLSEHVLYDLDADARASLAGDEPQDVAEDDFPDRDDPAELARMAAYWAENAPASAGPNPFLR